MVNIMMHGRTIIIVGCLGILTSLSMLKLVNIGREVDDTSQYLDSFGTQEKLLLSTISIRRCM